MLSLVSKDNVDEEDQAELINRIGVFVLMHLSDEYVAGNYISLEYDEAEGCEKVTLATVERWYGFVKDCIEATQSASPVALGS